MDAPRHTNRWAGRARGALGVLVLVGAVLLGGCHDPTEIVVVVDSDLKPGVDFEVIQFVLFTPSVPAGSVMAEATVLPATLGMIPQDFGPKEFHIMAVAAGAFDDTFRRKPIVSRRVSNIRFVQDEMRAVFIGLLRQCMCLGTNCDTNPPCNDIVTPTLTAFDEDNLPRLPAAP